MVSCGHVDCCGAGNLPASITLMYEREMRTEVPCVFQYLDTSQKRRKRKRRKKRQEEKKEKKQKEEREKGDNKKENGTEK